MINQSICQSLSDVFDCAWFRNITQIRDIGIKIYELHIFFPFYFYLKTEKRPIRKDLRF